MTAWRRILAFDCAGAACSAAVLIDDDLAGHRHEVMARGHSERLLPLIEEVMAEAGLGYRDLDGLAVARGPGGFTGLRIALATARGLALALDRPLKGVTNFAALAAAAPAGHAMGQAAGHDLLVAIESKRKDVYLQLWSDQGEALSDARALLPERVPAFLQEIGRSRPLLVLGDGRGALLPVLATLDIDHREAALPESCDAAWVARLAAADPAAATDKPPAPLYLRAPDVTLPKAIKP